MVVLLAWWDKSIRISTVRTTTINGENYLFVISVDVILWRKALVVLSNLIPLMTVKMDKPIFHVQGCVNS